MVQDMAAITRLFFLHLSGILCFTYFHIRNNEGQVAQNTRGKTHGYMGVTWGKTPTVGILPIKYYGRLVQQGWQ